jgi:hypothetical protein
MSKHTFLKVANVLHATARYIDLLESKEAAVKTEVKKVEEQKQKKVIDPIKEKISSLSIGDDIKNTLLSASDNVLEAVSQVLGKQAEEESGLNSWGSIEGSTASKRASAGKLDPIAAFALT